MREQNTAQGHLCVEVPGEHRGALCELPSDPMKSQSGGNHGDGGEVKEINLI